MRSLLWSLLFVLLLSTGAAAIRQVNFVGEMSVQEPTAVTVDEDGLLYVVRKSGTILVADQDMQILVEIGGKDSRLHDFLRSPAGLSAYNNRLYIADTRLDRVVVLTTSGDFVESFGGRGKAFGQFRSPSDVCVYRGVIYVADTGNNRIQVLGGNGVFLRAFGQPSDGSTSLDGPVRVAACNDGNIYVLDKTATVKIFNPDGTYLGSVAGEDSVSAFCLDETGVIVADGKRFSIKKYDVEGNLMLAFGSEGEGRAQFRNISALAVTPQGAVFAADTRRNRIQAFLPEKPESAGIAFQASAPPTSAFWETIINTDSKQAITKLVRKGEAVYALRQGSETILAITEDIVPAFTLDKITPEALAFDNQGSPYIMERQKVVKLTAQGVVDYAFGTPDRSRRYLPGDMVISDAGLVYVTDRQTPSIKIYNTDGIFIKSFDKYGDQPVLDPVALAVDEDGVLYVLDAGLQMLAVFSNDNKLLHRFPVGGDGADLVDMDVTAGHVYILDAGRERVSLFSAEGKHLAGFAASGEAPGFLSHPSAIVAGAGSGFWVAEAKNRRLQKFRVIYTPEPPRNIEAAAGPRQVRLQWDKPLFDKIDYYTVYRMVARVSGKPQRLGTTEICDYVDYTALTGVAGLYWVTATAAHGNESSLSAPVVSAAEKITVPPPQNPVAVPGDIAVSLSWEADPSVQVDRYIVYRDDKEVGSTVNHVYRVEGLVPETDYTFHISAVSVDNVESEAIPLAVRTQVTTRPPVEIEVTRLSDIFSNTYKHYENHGIGSVMVRNNTSEIISRLTVLFTMKHFMDFASETSLRDLMPGQSREIPLQAVFNNNILNVTEDTPVQTEITASYYLRGELKTFATKHSVNVYEKHKMRWDDSDRLGAFVTPRDPVMMEFVRSVIVQYKHTTDPLVSAAVIFNAFGALGLKYIVDPSSPYQEVKHNTELVDYLQYPRDTIRRKSGDCDDLAILYVAALESVGIRTRFVEVPGHILMMFTIGHQDRLGSDTSNDLLIIDDNGDDNGSVWVPVETTRVGNSFTDAWEAGSRNYYKCHPDERATVDLRQAWEKYKPASLPPADFKVPVISRETIDAQFQGEYDVIRRASVRINNCAYVVRLEKNPDDMEAGLQLGIAYARNGIFDRAQQLFENGLKNSPDNASLLNNIGNIYYLDGRFEKAVDIYQQAVRSEPDDPLIRINLVQALLQTGRSPEARKIFDEACAIDPDLTGRFRSLALKLPGPG